MSILKRVADARAGVVLNTGAKPFYGRNDHAWEFQNPPKVKH